MSNGCASLKCFPQLTDTKAEAMDGVQVDASRVYDRHSSAAHDNIGAGCSNLP
jgi:hypothetical protein